MLLCRPATHHEYSKLKLSREIGPPWKLWFLQDVVRQEQPAIVFLCETLSNKEKMEWICSQIGFQGMLVVEAEGRIEGVALLWRFSER